MYENADTKEKKKPKPFKQVSPFQEYIKWDILWWLHEYFEMF